MKGNILIFLLIRRRTKSRWHPRRWAKSLWSKRPSREGGASHSSTQWRTNTMVTIRSVPWGFSLWLKYNQPTTASHDDDEIYRQPLDEFFRENGRTAIAKRLRHIDIGENILALSAVWMQSEIDHAGSVCSCGKPSKSHTVLSTLVSNATNWEQVIVKL